jgi:hypothetical protein
MIRIYQKGTHLEGAVASFEEELARQRAMKNDKAQRLAALPGEIDRISRAEARAVLPELYKAIRALQAKGISDDRQRAIVKESTFETGVKFVQYDIRPALLSRGRVEGWRFWLEGGLCLDVPLVGTAAITTSMRSDRYPLETFAQMGHYTESRTSYEPAWGPAGRPYSERRQQSTRYEAAKLFQEAIAGIVRYLTYID